MIRIVDDKAGRKGSQNGFEHARFRSLRYDVAHGARAGRNGDESAKQCGADTCFGARVRKE